MSFSPRTYRSFDYANASTVHKVQGASGDAAVCVIDRSASAELVFVAASRSKEELEMVMPRTAFRDLDELASRISDGISLKTTTLTYGEVLERLVAARPLDSTISKRSARQLPFGAFTKTR